MLVSQAPNLDQIFFTATALSVTLAAGGLDHGWWLLALGLVVIAAFLASVFYVVSKINELREELFRRRKR